MATLSTHRTLGYALHDEMKVSSRGIGIFTSMIAVLAVVIALSYVLATPVAPTSMPQHGAAAPTSAP